MMQRVRLFAIAVTVALLSPFGGGVHAQCTSGAALIGSGGALSAGPSAWTGSAVAVATSVGAGRAIEVSIYDERGFALAAPQQIVPTSNRGPLALLWNGSELGLFFIADFQLHLQRLTAGGTPIGAPIRVDQRIFTQADEFDVAWDPVAGEWFAARTFTSVILSSYAMQITREGQIRSEVILAAPIGPRSRIRVAVTESGVGGVFHYSPAGDRLLYFRIERGGRTNSMELPLRGNDLVVAASGSRFIVMRSVALGDGRTGIRWFAISTDPPLDSIVRPDALLLTGSGIDVAPASLVVNGSELALAYLDSMHGFATFPATYRLRRMNLDGSVITDLPFAAAAPALNTGTSPFPMTWTGRSYVAAVGNVHAQPGNAYLLRYCLLRGVIMAPKTVARGEAVRLVAVPEGGVPEYRFHWNLGDRAIRHTPTVDYVYSEAGTYEVTLTLTDALNVTRRVTWTINVVEPKRRAVRH